MSVETLRRFNRTWTQRVGALDESFLGLGIPLGTARVLFEVAPDGSTVQDLRARLGLDSGYLSRVLRRLEAEGLVTVSPDPADRRRRLVRATASGRRTRAELERRSEELASRILDPLTERQQQRLAAALAEADLLVKVATLVVAQVPPTEPAARAAMAAYFGELDRRFPGGFDPGDTDDVSSMAAPHGVFLLATSDGQPVACGGLQPLEDGVAEVKRMWVEASWRGAGLGPRLLGRLEQEAVRLGRPVVRLDTNRTLTEAVAMYERAGYRRVERYNDNPYAEAFFEKRLAV